MAIYTRTQQKHDIEANWIKAINFIPLEGEIIIYDADENYSYQRIKIGDGITKVNDLPFDNIQGDWNQNNETAPDYIKNRTHYAYSTVVFEEYVNETTADYNGYSGYFFASNVDLFRRTREAYENGDYSLLQVKINNVLKNIVEIESWMNGEGEFATYALYLNDGTWLQMIEPEYGCYHAEYTEELIPITIGAMVPIEKIQQLDEKYIPETIARKDWVTEEIEDSSETLIQIVESTNDSITDILAELDELSSIKALAKDLEPIDLLAKLKIQNQYIQDYPLTDLEFITLFQNKIQNYTQAELFNLFNYFYNKYNNLKIMPVFKIAPDDQGNLSSRYSRLCSTIRVELDSIRPENGSTVDPEFDLKYYIDLSDNAVLKINFNYMMTSNPDGTFSEIPWNNLNSSNGIMTITFASIQKGSNVVDLVTAAEEQIIIPALTEGQY